MEISRHHLETMRGKVFKILPLFQSENQGLSNYIWTLKREFEGLCYLIENDTHESMLTTVTSLLEIHYDDSLAPKPDIATIKRELFGMTNLVEKIIQSGDYD